MANTKKPAAKSAAKNGDVEALVLVDCEHGKCGEVKTFDADLAATLVRTGVIDPHPNAVAAHRKA